ncbi:hydrogenase expression/formation protein HypE [Desulfoprunum benzoelyticum]|uniref:Hydrogenase expression/formation protein HypE n=1 Tax=Desulfoprunum benzoelyticum TaxID=1506996 RepID=A0A840V4U3_9BACT|nr:hydrogenase expression/formation protein HypE [Desulfoprunum benzoelyticum]MBB5348111.1 hydrogenase expression/formation protein HypE [Desulfoprunum benzoelyticum]MBM9530278.1 hydrogenase expression/formation protein HypE [Desulfoprunum benzoelyticum]
MADKCILLDHGSGGLASQELISSLFVKHLDNPTLRGLEDSAVLERPAGRLAFTTDSYVVDPIFFPGGDIGMLAVHGTINDLAMRGAQPLCLSLGLILEEGMALDDLERIVVSIAACCRDSGVPVVTGDTKVVPRGKGDKIFINTSGIGVLADGIDISSKNAREGDVILLSGTMGDHGITIMTRRAGISMQGRLESDTRPLHRLVQRLLEGLPGGVRTLRDPTRGGVATTLNEIAANSGLGVELREEFLPVRPQVRAACELLGLEPLYLANEGKLLAVVSADQAETALRIMRETDEGAEAAIIGRMVGGKAGRVVITTPLGGMRMVTPLHGEPLPRIC